METRRNTHQKERPQSVRVPERTGASSRPTLPKAPVQAPQPVIPLLDEQKPASKFARIAKLPLVVKHHPKKSLLALSLLLVSGYAITHLPQKPSSVAVKGAQSGQSGPAQLPRNETPKFETVLPAGKTIDSYGGWARISPPDRDPVFAYADKLGGIPITVSQQPLPKNIEDDIDTGLEKLAKDFQAEQKLTVGETTAYIGTSAKGPQSVILAKNNLLILIKSTSKIDNGQWTAYISSLQ